MNHMHEIYMQRCIDLASQGLGNVSPNPLVGCVIVHENKIIGEGYHQQYGLPHAEVNAIAMVADKSLLLSSTLYVNLEPCCHQGKTPPCTDLIIKSKIPHVVIANVDTFEKVNGKGIAQLQQAGIKVETGILDKEARMLNRRFFTAQEKKRPFIFLKWAQTLDGFMDKERKDTTPSPGAWITNQELKKICHKWRAEEDAIMVGRTTALNDNPQLNVREWVGKNPTRVILDKNLEIPSHYHIFDNSIPTILFNQRINKVQGLTQWVQLDFTQDILEPLLTHLSEKKIQSIIIEGGAILLNSFISKGLWDEATVQVGNKTFYKGLQAPTINNPPEFIEDVKGDKLIHYHNY